MSESLKTRLLSARGQAARASRKRPHRVLSVAEVDRLVEVRPVSAGGLARVIGTQRARWYGRWILAAITRDQRSNTYTRPTGQYGRPTTFSES
jgi:hypothetical protein